ncbi:hypothetical protein [Azospirillum sp. INR13]|uniref:hypothetical protein n=1 Tax=Azospirillum sp. INR13 TaxID=2596919 RepID=UPI002103463C|nr:hypothetical protein [Azospirillum sp. INR13]
MKERVVNVYDLPPAAVPDSAKYLAAMTYRASREAKALRLKRWTFALAVLGLSWGSLMTWDNLRIAGKLVEIARYKPIYRVEQAMDGHQRLVLLDNTLTVTKGARINAVQWFVRWQRQIGTDPVMLAKDRAAARARLTGGAERKWDALLAVDLAPARAGPATSPTSASRSARPTRRPALPPSTWCGRRRCTGTSSRARRR